MKLTRDEIKALKDEAKRQQSRYENTGDEYHAGAADALRSVLFENGTDLYEFKVSGAVGATA